MGAAGSAGDSARDAYEALAEGELLELIPSLERDALQQLRAHEASHQARKRVLDALDHQLARHARAATAGAARTGRGDESVKRRLRSRRRTATCVRRPRQYHLQRKWRLSLRCSFRLIRAVPRTARIAS